MSKNSTICGNEVKASEATGEARQETRSRLHKHGACMPSAEGCPETAWLAERRWDVTGFDAAAKAVAPALENRR
jgi:hypothetical protein